MAATKPPALLQSVRTRNPLWLLPVFCCGVILALNLIRINTLSQAQTYIQLAKPPEFERPVDYAGFLVKTSGCRIPNMKPMDHSIRKYIFKENPVICNNGLPPLMDSNFTAIFLIESSMNEYNVTDETKLECCYRRFERIAPKNSERDKEVAYHDCVRFDTHTAIGVTDEYVNVVCKYNDSVIYEDYFSFVVPPKTSDNVNLVDGTPFGDSNKLNVLIIGLDAISRLNFLRQMPKTVKFLDQYQAVSMLGYNKVADNTFPNLMPVLTGHHEAELKDTCWPDTDDHFDNCTFLWDIYKRAGYVTAFGEDSAWMGIFNYQKKGFKQQPTDYFWDQFNWEAENKIGDSHLLNVFQCIGSRVVHRVLLDYIEKFCAAVARNPYFALFWQSSLSHDILNKPQLGDDDYYWLLKNLHDGGYLNRTVLLVMSDHGIRWGDIRATFQGRMEERLPFLYVGLPEWLREQVAPHLQDNLRTNSRRLTTPFDLHETLLDLLQPLDQLTPAYLDQRNGGVSQRGYSLFAPIRESRRCDEAGIPPHYCTCQSSVPIATNMTVVAEAANYTVTHINNMLIGYADCAILELDAVLDARMRTNHEDLMKNQPITDYVVSLRTKPGGALFEATVRRTGDKRHRKGGLSDSGRLDITGTISRINMYGEQSLCVTDYHLKLYCYCKQFIPGDYIAVN